jgi:hypothetical protein
VSGLCDPNINVGADFVSIPTLFTCPINPVCHEMLEKYG